MTIAAGDIEARMQSSASGGSASREGDQLAHVLEAAESLAKDISASEFSILLVVRRASRERLLAALDTSSPSISIVSRLLSTMDSGELPARVRTSSKPFWWNGTEASSLRNLRWADQVMPPLPGIQGIAFPVFDETGQGGLLAFTGNRIDLDDQALVSAHARCFSVFEDYMRMQTTRFPRPAISKRERECLSLTANGHSSGEIAALLGLSIHTTNQHIASMTEKLDATNRMHAVAKALRLGLIE